MASTQNKRVVLILGLLALLVTAAVFGYRELAKARPRSLIVSSNNHERFLWMALIEFGSQNGGTLPYEAGAPGYMMLRNFSMRTVAHVNCNHGAPANRVGGWQAVNLPPEAWLVIVQQWKRPLSERPIPFAWCGKPTGTGSRVVTAVTSHSQEHGLSLHHFNMEERELTDSLSELNQILETLGIPPVPVDVPDGVAWAEVSNQNRMEPQPAVARDGL